METNIENPRMERGIPTVTIRCGEYGAEFQKSGTGVYLVSPWRAIPGVGKRFTHIPTPTRLVMVTAAKTYFFLGTDQRALPLVEAR